MNKHTYSMKSWLRDSIAHNQRRVMSGENEQPSLLQKWVMGFIGIQIPE